MTKQECFTKLDNIDKSDLTSPIDCDIIEECKLIISQIDTNPEIRPTVNDTIQLQYKTNKIYIELEVFWDKYILFVNAYDKSASSELYCREDAIQWWNILTDMAKHTI